MQLVFFWFLFLAFISFASAQSITITSPSTNAVYGEADDFATQELQNPWDMEERRDIGWEEAYVGSSVEAVNGIWRGTNETSAAYIFPLFGGFAGDGKIESPNGDLEVPRLGINHRIETSKYTHLSIKYKHTDPNYITAYWKNDEEGVRWPIGENFVNFPAKSMDLSDTWNVRVLSLAGNDGETWSDDPQSSTGSWTGDVMTFRIDPSFDDQAGDFTEIDWIRLFDPTTSPEITFTWNYTGMSNDQFVLYADTNSSNFDGFPVHISDQTVTGAGSANQTFNLGALPPGTYYFYVATADGSIRSGYSARIIIDGAPTGYFIAPSKISGRDYAVKEVGNIWDMNDTSDVPNLNTTLWPQDWRQFVNPQFSDGVFSASAEPAYEGRTESDAQVHLNVNSANPIDTRLYRYLTYTMEIDPSGFTHISDKVKRGWVARAAWWDTSFAVDHGSSRFHVVYEGMNTYTIDLWDPDMRRFGREWLENPQIRNLRIDPLETDQFTTFRIDSAMLTAEPRTSNERYRIIWNIEDDTIGPVTVDLYWDNDDSGFDGTLIASRAMNKGSQSTVWDTSDLDDTPKYIYLVVTDSNGVQNRFYAGARLQVQEYQPPVNIDVPNDYDGDGASDEVVYRNSIGTFFTNMSSNGPTATAFGGMPFEPIDGDFDGDGRSDFTVTVNFNGFINWFSVRSSDNQLQGVSWGLPGDRLVVADFNGDRTDDYAVYRNGLWFIFDLQGQVTIAAWGLPDDIPVPADYDGDGTDDIAIWRPSDGNWWILNSGFASGSAATPFSVKQWGLPGDIPLPADMDVDGKADFVVWREASGHWFINNTQDESIEVIQWGLPGDIPQIGDYNGDGLADVSVFRPGLSYWFHNFRDGQAEAVQWGLSTDLRVK